MKKTEFGGHRMSDIGFGYTGKGGFFLNGLYEEAYSVETIRKTPASVDELKEAGLSPQEIKEYFSLIKRLYGELFLASNMLTSSENATYEAQTIWADLYHFCVSHKLTAEFGEENGNVPSFLRRIPFEVENYFFVWRSKDCIGAFYLATLDDFRLVVEMSLANLTIDWYLRLRYDVYIVAEEAEGEELLEKLLHFDCEMGKLAPLSEVEVLYLLGKIRQDLEDCQYRLAQHNADMREKGNVLCDTAESRIKWEQFCRDWFIGSNELFDEEFSLTECEEIVSNIIESGVHNGIVDTYPDDTLYIHKGIIVCQKNNHAIEQAVAILSDKNGNDIRMNVCHCQDCRKFFMHYDIYKHYRQKYGVIMGNIHMTSNDELTRNVYDLAEESPLKMCGYSVSQKDSLSSDERQRIIASCIESGAMTKEAVIRLLRWFVEVNGNKIGNELARTKWREDLDYALNYNITEQSEYKIGRMTRYKRNQFVCTGILK